MAATASRKNVVPEQIAKYILRAWASGEYLTSEQLEWLAGRITDLKPVWVSERLTHRKEAANKLFFDLWQVFNGLAMSIKLLPYFPAEVISLLPDDVLAPLLRTAANSGQTLDTTLLKLLLICAARPEGEEWRRVIEGMARRQNNQLLEIINLVQEIKSTSRLLLQMWFPLLLQLPPTVDVASVLSKLTLYGDLNQGDDELAICLDTWQALLTYRKKLLLLQGRGIEGRDLVNVVNEWLEYRNKPHQLDMMVIILRHVKTQNPSTWLTPASLELQVLCAGGRFTEATQLISQYSELRVGRRSANEYLKNARIQGMERQPGFEASLKRLWNLILMQ